MEQTKYKNTKYKIQIAKIPNTLIQNKIKIPNTKYKYSQYRNTKTNYKNTEDYKHKIPNKNISTKYTFKNTKIQT